MPYIKNLIGKIFGKLTVISKAPSILGGQKVKRYWGAWNCECKCGNNIVVKTLDLNRGGVKSCGCLYDDYGKSLKPNQKINKLTTISYNNGKWLCKCDCGNIINTKTNSINSGNTKSCGCLKIETSRNKSDKLINGRRKFNPQIASARRVWKNYIYRDKNCNISFDDFYIKSQQNCTYCGIQPNTEYNYFLTKSSNSSDIAKIEGSFIYNGLDRINSNLPHILNNVVACCPLCNRAKNNRSLSDFIFWVKLLSIKEQYNININKIQLPKNGSLLTSIKCTFYNYKKDTDLTLEEYYSVSQMKCFYCNSSPNNIFNRAKIDKKASIVAKENGNYIYNGLDRIDSNLNHNKNNIVPCCKYCNFAKGKLSIHDFNNWIIRIKDFQK